MNGGTGAMHVKRMNGMKKLAGAVCCLAVFAAMGCASKWAMEGGISKELLVWPQAPEKPKIRHVMTIQGFKEMGGSLKAVFVGKGENMLIHPVAVATDRDGRIAVADTGSQSVHLYHPKEKKYVKIYRSGSKDFQSPVGLAFDAESNLYVSDSSLDTISVYDGGGRYLRSMNGGKIKRPTGIAYDREKKAILAVDTASNVIHALTSNGEPLFSFGERGLGKGQFNFPTHIFFSPSGRIYVTDAMNFRIQIFDSSGKFISSFGRHGDGSGDFSMPKGVASDGEGTIYVVDTLFDNIQLFNEKGEFLLTLGNRGTGQGEFWLPSGIFIDEENRLYVCDTYNHRIQMFEITKDGR
jgi:DNA-binding beta-propeller fold protein YncE